MIIYSIFRLSYLHSVSFKNNFSERNCRKSRQSDQSKWKPFLFVSLNLHLMVLGGFVSLRFMHIIALHVKLITQKNALNYLIVKSILYDTLKFISQ